MVFHGANTNKRAITLDLRSPEGVAVAERLIADADVVIENFTPRVMEGFGLTWERLSALNPRLIMTRMPAFGPERGVAQQHRVCPDDGAAHRDGGHHRVRR